jgi:phage protein D
MFGGHTLAVTLDGISVEDSVSRHLIEISVTDQNEGSSNTAQLLLDDSEGKLLLPEISGRVEISLDDVQVFRGTVAEVRSTAPQGLGRLLTVSCRGLATWRTRGEGKTALEPTVPAEWGKNLLSWDISQFVGQHRSPKAGSERRGRKGSVVMLLTPQARAEGSLELVGTRPGVDGSYRIVRVSHKLTSASGETNCQVEQFGEGAGQG